MLNTIDCTNRLAKRVSVHHIYPLFGLTTASKLLYLAHLPRSSRRLCFPAQQALQFHMIHFRSTANNRIGLAS